MRILKTLPLLALLLAAPSAALPARAQATPHIVSGPPEHLFGDHITFTATVERPEELRQALVFYRPRGQDKTFEAQLSVSPDGRAVYRLDASGSPLPVFTPLEFWFHAEWQNNQEHTTEAAEYTYTDNRFQWRTIASELLAVHWYQGEVAFAQEISDAAVLGTRKIATTLGLDLSQRDYFQNPINIYVYASARDLQSALSLGAPKWVAGHADPDLNMVLASINPDDPGYLLEVERQIPHELAHILLYRSTGPGYTNLPIWLNEGIASINELFPNPDYPLLLQNAYQSDGGLLALESLCHTFPGDASQALLAYAQATSLTRFVVDHYGRSGLQALVREYADGKSCQAGAPAALNLTLGDLERDWRQATFSENAWLVSLARLLPGLLLMAVLLVPLAFAAITGRRGARRRAQTKHAQPELPQGTLR